MNFDFGFDPATLAQYAPPPQPGAEPAAPAADAPPAEAPAPAPPPAVSKDQYQTPEWKAAMMMSAVADYGEMPWGAVMDTHLPLYDAARTAGLDEEGIGLMQGLAQTGQLDAVGDGGRTLGREVVERMANGAVTNDVAKVLLQQVLDPDANILQMTAHNCVAATAQKAMAVDDPALYFVTALDLVRGGVGNLPSGEQAIVSAANQAAIQAAGLTGADLVDATFQAALMDHANGADTYDLATDRSTRADGRTYLGLSEAQAAELNSDALQAPTLLGSNVRAAYEAAQQNPIYVDLGEWGGSFSYTPTRAMVVAEFLQGARRENFPGVLVAVADPASGDRHMVLVRDLNAKTNQVTVMDAYGRSTTQDFHAFVETVAFPESADIEGIGGYTGRAATTTSSSTRTSTGLRSTGTGVIS